MSEELVHSVVRTRDHELAVAAMDTIVGHRARIRIEDRGAGEFQVLNAGLSGWGAFHLEMPGVHYDATTVPEPFLVAGVLDTGRGRFQGYSREVAVTPGDGWLYPTGLAFHAEWLNMDISGVKLPPDYVACLAEEVYGLPAENLRFLWGAPVSAQLRDFWAGTMRYLAPLLNAPGRRIPALMAAELQRHAAGALLQTFPNTAMTTPYLPGPGGTTPAVVRRAVAFIDEHAGEPVTVAKIAAAAGVGIRTLQAAFRRHLDTSPAACLRRTRLRYAHQELRDADPADPTAVTTIALRWGFAGAARFAAEYRAAFGEEPDHTLRTWNEVPRAGRQRTG